MGRPSRRHFTPPTDEPTLPRAERRASGVYYTPPEIVRELVAKTLEPLIRGADRGHSGKQLRVLDPACGAGAMLVEADRPGVALFGVDSDAAAVAATRQSTGAVAWSGDALFDLRLENLAPFDAIVANPPYVNIRQLAKAQSPDYIQRLRSRFRTARGNFDLYVVFLERAMELLRDGGCCGMIVPGKWATLDYARPLRDLLLTETTIEHVVDLSSQPVFAGASVYPHVIVFSKRKPPARHVVSVTAWNDAGKSDSTISQANLSAQAINLGVAMNVEARAAARPLGELCVLSCGTAGYSAQRIAHCLQERAKSTAADARDFITSGNIDRYSLRLGNVRYLGRKYERPVLPLEASGVTQRQRRLFAGQKIVIAGLSQRLESAWDEHGLALGVQVFAASDFQIDPQQLLAILNSKLLTYLFRTRFAAKRLAGGYMAINKGQLARLPIVVPRRTSDSLVRAAGDATIDRQVYRLYRLTKAEIATIESHFAELGRRAA